MEEINKRNLGSVIESMCGIVGISFKECFEEHSPKPRVTYLNKFDYKIDYGNFSTEQKLKLLGSVLEGFSFLDDYSDYIGPQNGYDFVAYYQYSSKTKSFEIHGKKGLNTPKKLLKRLDELNLIKGDPFKDFIRKAVTTRFWEELFLNPTH